MIRERLMLCIINIFLPPLTVMLVAGIGPDCLFNTLLFLLGVIPGHIHGYYITFTYFSRKKKVRKGIYPGGPKWGIFSERVWYGGRSEREVRGLVGGKDEKVDLGLSRKGSSGRGGSRRGSDVGRGGGGGGGGVSRRGSRNGNVDARRIDDGMKRTPSAISRISAGASDNGIRRIRSNAGSNVQDSSGYPERMYSSAGRSTRTGRAKRNGSMVSAV